MANRWGMSGNSGRLCFPGLKITADDCSHEIQRHLLLGRKNVTNLERILKAQTLLYLQRSYSQSYVFSSSHVWLWELDIKESWVLKNWYFWTVVLEKTLERPLDCKDIQLVHPKGNQSWIFTGRTVADTPIFFHLMWTTDSLEKTLILEKIEGRRRGGGEQMIWLLYNITYSMDMSLKKICKLVMDREVCHAAVYGVTENQTCLRDRSGLRKMSLSLEVSLRIIPAQI